MYLVQGKYFLHMTSYLKYFSSELAYSPHLYSESLDMQPEVLYIKYTTSYHEQTGNIITFAQFEDGGLVLKNVTQKNLIQFHIQVISYLYTMTLVTDL